MADLLKLEETLQLHDKHRQVIWEVPERQDDPLPILSSSDIEMGFYEKFFFSKDLEPYPVQEEAFERIFRGDNVLITVPTGTGKTMIAKAGMYKALYSGKTAIYTTPLRALTEEKYRELCDDFGEEHVGFATGDYKINAKAPIQVVVAEILWNQIFSSRQSVPADVVIMDEGHYFNDPERGYVWEQSIIGLHPNSQLIVLSATVGNPEQFCQWSYLVRRVPMQLVTSYERKVPLFHKFEEEYLVDRAKDLFHHGEYPVIIFVFGRQQCFEYARLLKSCRRFTTDAEQKEIEAKIEPILIPKGMGETLRSLLMHGIGVHHAGILPAYKRLVEELTLRRLIKFVVSTETISAGINLPAKRVLFPSLRKHIKGKARLLRPDEYHQMAGRAGRPQFDTEGIAITLAPEQVIQELRKELSDAARSPYKVDEEQIRRRAYSRARSKAQQNDDLIWDPEVHKALVEGKPAALKSHTKITAEQILAIGLPDLGEEQLPGEELVKAELEAKERRRIEREQEIEQRAKEKERREQQRASGKAFRGSGLGSAFSALSSLIPTAPKTESEENATSEAQEDTSTSETAEATSSTAATSSTEATETAETKFAETTDTAEATTETAEVEAQSPASAETSDETSVTDEASAKTEATEQAETPEGTDVAADVTTDVAAEKRPKRSFSRLPKSEQKYWMDQALALEKKPRMTAPEELPYHGVYDLRTVPKQKAHYKLDKTSVENFENLSNLPAYLNLNIRTIIDNLFLEEMDRREAHKVLVKITANLKAMEILNERGVQEKGEMIGQLRGFDGPFVYYCLMEHDLSYERCRQLVEFLVDHDIIQKRLNRKDEEKKKEWIRNRLRERRQENSQVTWDDVREEYEREFPRQLEWIEEVHQSFIRLLPHPELHGGKLYKHVWADMEDNQQTFMEFVLQHDLDQEEGSLFSYLARVMKSARLLHEVTEVKEFYNIEFRIRQKLAVIDDRILDELW
ncbi:MAG: DEAD/DEAH box helicase [Myxococcales bacterium]|nr:DEAD/DEAH box helicase [Myxococcales bacterium]